MIPLVKKELFMIIYMISTNLTNAGIFPLTRKAETIESAQ